MNASAVDTATAASTATAGSTATATASAAPAPAGSWLTHVPVPLFAVVMGLGGLGLAWRRAHEDLGAPAAIGEAILALAALLFLAIAGLYLTKAARHGAEVAAEFRHPIRVSFFPTVSVSLLILAIAALPYGHGLADLLWWSGAALHLALALAIVNRWITRHVEIQHSSPAWFIPVVGNILVPVAGVPLGHAAISWFFFSIGLVFWLVLFTIVLYRIIFHDPLPRKVLPTLFILMAPPAIGLVAHLQLNGGALDTLCHLLFSTALFIALLLLTMARRFLAVPFFVSWWAYTFPSAAMAIAALLYHALVPGLGTGAIAVAALALATGIIALVSGRTLAALVRGRLFVPE